MNDDPASLQQRIRELERIEADYRQLERLIDDAAHDQASYAPIKRGIIWIDPDTRQVIDANHDALHLLGYSLEAITALTISELEQPTEDTARPGEVVPLDERHIDTQIYPAVYTHRAGHRLPVHAFRREDTHNGRSLVAFHLEERSLARRLSEELRRRETDGFVFQGMLKILSGIILELSRIEDADTLCREAIRLGIARLGFDRLAIWFLDTTARQMRGCYGVDELGQIRAEHNQTWHYGGTYIMEFINGRTDAALAYDDEPLRNHASEVIGYGWHISAPMLYGDLLIGLLTSDNHLNHQPMLSFQPELLRQYGIALGYLTQLARSRKQADALREEQQRTAMLREFVTHIGHDFRNPLSTIGVDAYVISRTTSSDRARQMADRIQTTVRTLSNMITRMFEFVALQTEIIIRPASFSVDGLVKETIDAHRAALNSKRLNVEFYPHDEPIILSGDRMYLGRALGQIVRNAIDYTPEGGTIMLYTRRFGDKACIAVQDTGIGIPRSDLERIFAPLYRVDAARSERQAGLGLAIARSIVHAHDGEIYANSTLGIGSTFEIVLPIP